MIGRKTVACICAILSMSVLTGTVSAASLSAGIEAADIAIGEGQSVTTVKLSEEVANVPTAGVSVCFNGASLLEETQEHTSVAVLEARQAEISGLYAGVAISQVTNYVNIREEADAQSEILGKIYNNAAAWIQETVETEDGTWYKIKSGSVVGYIKAEYFVTGDEALELAQELGTIVATVNTATLRLRAEAAIDSTTLSLLAADEKYIVAEEVGDFLRLTVDSDLEGYVYRDYVTLSVEFDEAISLEEEQAELERQAQLEKERLEAEEQLRQAQAAAAAAATSKSTTKSSSSTSSTTKSSTSTTAASTTKSSSSSSSTSSSSLRSAIVAYATSFVGKLSYVYGGTSLTSGVDCSGFVQQVFAHYGISLPRTSDEQGYSGTKVSSSEMQPGDLVYYGGHIAIYIGNGQVVHASNSKSGVKISTWNYRTPKSIRNVIG